MSSNSWWRAGREQGRVPTESVDDALVSRFIQANLSRYDKTGDTHYDIASALIKSIRSSDPDGAVYWLARMIEGGEDPKFIARRLLISASEDIGHANPTALVLANATFDAVERLGYPECRIPLSQCATYLRRAPSPTAPMPPLAWPRRPFGTTATCRCPCICATRRRN